MACRFFGTFCGWDLVTQVLEGGRALFFAMLLIHVSHSPFPVGVDFVLIGSFLVLGVDIGYLLVGFIAFSSNYQEIRLGDFWISRFRPDSLSSLRVTNLTPHESLER